MEDEFSEDDFNRFNQKLEQLEEVARKCGIYLEDANIVLVPTPFGPRPAIVGEFTIGDVAFVQRVQDPEQDQIDKTFSDMTHMYGMDEFLDARERFKKNVEEGRNPFDEREK